MTHAFFKALLFLAAGVVIEALGDEHDIFKMGGLRRELPVVFWTFIIGAASLAALPLVTAGFYSKDLIIATSLGSVDGNAWLWLGALAGALLTSHLLVPPRLRRLLRRAAARRSRAARAGACSCRSSCSPSLSVVGGFVWLPEWMGGFDPLETLPRDRAAADAAGRRAASPTPASRRCSSSLIVSLVGIALAYAALAAPARRDRSASPRGPRRTRSQRVLAAPAGASTGSTSTSS